jgi:hypothetical protein
MNSKQRRQIKRKHPYTISIAEFPVRWDRAKTKKLEDSVKWLEEHMGKKGERWVGNGYPFTTFNFKHQKDAVMFSLMCS